jgi:hypothetical protein
MLISVTVQRRRLDRYRRNRILFFRNTLKGKTSLGFFSLTAPCCKYRWNKEEAHSWCNGDVCREEKEYSYNGWLEIAQNRTELVSRASTCDLRAALFAAGSVLRGSSGGTPGTRIPITTTRNFVVRESDKSNCFSSRASKKLLDPQVGLSYRFIMERPEEPSS